MGAQRVERKLVLMGNGGKARGSTNSRAMQKFQKQIDRGMPRTFLTRFPSVRGQKASPKRSPLHAGISNGNFVSVVPEVSPPRTFGQAFLGRLHENALRFQDAGDLVSVHAEEAKKRLELSRCCPERSEAFPQ